MKNKFVSFILSWDIIPWEGKKCSNLTNFKKCNSLGGSELTELKSKKIEISKVSKNSEVGIRLEASKSLKVSLNFNFKFVS